MRIRDRLINKSQGIEIKLFGKYFTKSFSKFENTKLFLGWVKHERYITTCCRCNKNEVFYEGGICESVDFKGTCFIKIRSRLEVIIHA